MNNRRIGFSCYNKNREKKEINVLDIIDKNKHILKQIEQLDDTISK